MYNMKDKQNLAVGDTGRCFAPDINGPSNALEFLVRSCGRGIITLIEEGNPDVIEQVAQSVKLAMSEFFMEVDDASTSNELIINPLTNVVYDDGTTKTADMLAHGVSCLFIAKQNSIAGTAGVNFKGTGRKELKTWESEEITENYIRAGYTYLLRFNQTGTLPSDGHFVVMQLPKSSDVDTVISDVSALEEKLNSALAQLLGEDNTGDLTGRISEAIRVALAKGLMYVGYIKDNNPNQIFIDTQHKSGEADADPDDLTQNYSFLLVSPSENTGTIEIDYNSTGLKPVKIEEGGALKDIEAGDVRQGGMYSVTYDESATNFPAGEGGFIIRATGLKSLLEEMEASISILSGGDESGIEDYEDDTQLAKAVLKGVRRAVDPYIPNASSTASLINIDSRHTSTKGTAEALYEGMSITVEAKHTSTGALEINFAGLGVKDAVHWDGSAIKARDIIAGRLYFFVYKSGKFRVKEYGISGIPMYFGSQDDAGNTITISSDISGRTLTADEVRDSLHGGMVFFLSPSKDNTGAVQIKLGEEAPLNARIYDSVIDGQREIISGDVGKNQFYVVTHDPTGTGGYHFVLIPLTDKLPQKLGMITQILSDSDLTVLNDTDLELKSAQAILLAIRRGILYRQVPASIDDQGDPQGSTADHWIFESKHSHINPTSGESKSADLLASEIGFITKATVDNTGAMTVDFCGKGSKPLRLMTHPNNDLAAGAVKAGDVYFVEFVSTSVDDPSIGYFGLTSLSGTALHDMLRGYIEESIKIMSAGTVTSIEKLAVANRLAIGLGNCYKQNEQSTANKLKFDSKHGYIENGETKSADEELVDGFAISFVGQRENTGPAGIVFADIGKTEVDDGGVTLRIYNYDTDTHDELSGGEIKEGHLYVAIYTVSSVIGAFWELHPYIPASLLSKVLGIEGDVESLTTQMDGSIKVHSPSSGFAGYYVYTSDLPTIPDGYGFFLSVNVDSTGPSGYIKLGEQSGRIHLLTSEKLDKTDLDAGAMNKDYVYYAELQRQGGPIATGENLWLVRCLSSLKLESRMTSAEARLTALETTTTEGSVELAGDVENLKNQVSSAVNKLSNSDIDASVYNADNLSKAIRTAIAMNEILKPDSSDNYNALVFTSKSGGAEKLQTGYSFKFTPLGENSGVATINYGGLGEKLIATSWGTNTPARFLNPNYDYRAKWDGSKWVVDKIIRGAEDDIEWQIIRAVYSKAKNAIYRKVHSGTNVIVIHADSGPTDGLEIVFRPIGANTQTLTYINYGNTANHVVKMLDGSTEVDVTVGYFNTDVLIYAKYKGSTNRWIVEKLPTLQSMLENINTLEQSVNVISQRSGDYYIASAGATDNIIIIPAKYNSDILYDGKVIFFNPAKENYGSAVINFGGTGNKPVKTKQGENVGMSFFHPVFEYGARYDGTNWIAWQTTNTDTLIDTVCPWEWATWNATTQSYDFTEVTEDLVTQYAETTNTVEQLRLVTPSNYSKILCCRPKCVAGRNTVMNISFELRIFLEATSPGHIYVLAVQLKRNTNWLVREDTVLFSSVVNDSHLSFFDRNRYLQHLKFDSTASGFGSYMGFERTGDLSFTIQPNNDHIFNGRIIVAPIYHSFHRHVDFSFGKDTKWKVRSTVLIRR